MRLRALVADITTLRVDAIVNAANEALAPGGGVCGAIHDAAGPELARATAAHGGCRTGESRITPGFRLPAGYVIHAVGPVWSGGGSGEAERLRAAYTSAMRLATGHGCRSVAFPAISTGIYGYPLEEATRIAVQTVAAFSGEPGAPEEVVFACFGVDVLAAYREADVVE